MAKKSKPPALPTGALPGLERIAPYTLFNRRCDKCNNWLALTPGKDGLICLENSCTDQLIQGVVNHRPTKENEG